MRRNDNVHAAARAPQAHDWLGNECRLCWARKGWPLAEQRCPMVVSGCMRARVAIKARRKARQRAAEVVR